MKKEGTNISNLPGKRVSIIKRNLCYYSNGRKKQSNASDAGDGISVAGN
jgi:hypothetical protein